MLVTSYCNKWNSFDVNGNMFHGVVIEEVVYKVEVHGVMLHATTFMFPNLKKKPFVQLLLKDVKGQFTFWKGVNM